MIDTDNSGLKLSSYFISTDVCLAVNRHKFILSMHAKYSLRPEI
jgi:hypothetical protein